MKFTTSLPVSLVAISVFTTTTALPVANPNWKVARSVTATEVAAREPLGSLASALLGLEALGDTSFGAAKRSEIEDVEARDPFAGALLKILPTVAPIAIDIFKKVFGRDVASDEALVNAILNSRSDENAVTDVEARDPFAGALLKILPTVAPIAIDIFKKVFGRDLSDDELEQEIAKAIFSRSVVDATVTDIAAREPSFGSFVKLIPTIAPIAIDLFKNIFGRDVEDDALDQALAKAIFGRSASTQDLDELAALVNALSR